MIKKTNTTIKKAAIRFVFTIALVLMASAAMAQTDFPDDVEDVPAAAPIDDYVWILALLGLVFVFMKFRSIKNRKIKG